ncbi:MAG: T9SS type A sorting domain-containing protein [Bacteroidia bacterium]|nr:T9SS type A sorting domain-containing protein [Bacteroidia bacterium]
MKKIVLFGVFALIIWVGCLNAQPTLLKNINNDFCCNYGGQGISYETYHNGKLLFVAKDKYSIDQIWKSDGTPDGTGVIKDLNPNGMYSFKGFGKLTGGRALFQRYNSITGEIELWKTDYTSNGTVMLKTLTDSTGIHGGIEMFLGNWGNQYYFLGRYDSMGYVQNDLWVTNETTPGTVRLGTLPAVVRDWDFANGKLFLVCDNDPNSNIHSLYSTDGVSLSGSLAFVFGHNWSNQSQLMAPVGNQVVFMGEALATPDSLMDFELWGSDGTVNGTGLIKDIYPDTNPNAFNANSSGPQYFEVLNGKVYFAATTLTLTNVWYDTIPQYIANRELWTTDGTNNGTYMVRDIVLNDYLPYDFYYLSSNPQDFKQAGNILYFWAMEGPMYNYPNGWTLWKTDGTQTGTVRVKENMWQGANWREPTVLGTKLLFRYYENQMYRPWATSGTSASTVRLNNNMGWSYQNYVPQMFYVAGSNAYFEACYDGYNATGELWKTNGTPSGTSLVKGNLSGLKLLGGGSFLFFQEIDWYNGMSFLSKSSGTSGTTSRIRTILPKNLPSNPRYFTDVNGTVYFSAETSALGRELYKTNGTSAGTSVTNLNPGAAGSDPKGLIHYNGKLYFWGENPTNGREVWKADPAGGTVTLLKNVGSGGNSGYAGNDNFGIANNLLFFSGYNGTNYGLWKSDGTGTGTTLVKYLYIDPNSPFVEMGGNIYFVAYDPLFGCPYEIWKSDGTATGTVAVSASGCNPPGYSANVTSLTKSGSYVYFNATDVNGDIELWKTDGTPAGTGLVKNIHTTASSDPKSLTDVNGILYFSASSGTLGEELWKSDGTATGTVLVKNINTTSNTGSTPSSLIAYNGALYFFASSGTPGKELWKSDGTNAGTILLKDIYAGTGQGFYMDGTPKNKLMAIVGNKLYFFGRTGINGVELWRTDGTAAGTVMVKDLNPGATDCVNTAAGPGSEEGGHLCASGTTLYLAAEGADYGTEPYVFSGAGLRMRDDSGIAEEMLSEGWSDWKTPEQNRFKLYPNPVANQFYIETELNMTLSLSEVSGKVIRTLSVSQGLNEINTEGLSSGVYLLQWMDENGESGVVKVVKE